MRAVVYLLGFTAIFDGVLHLLFPNRWDALWVNETRRLLPGLGEFFAWMYRRYPAKRRFQGLGWIALGALILWVAGSAEGEKV